MLRTCFPYRQPFPNKKHVWENPKFKRPCCLKLHFFVWALIPAFIFLWPQAVKSQPISLNEAIKLALENNFKLQIARNNLQTATINNHPGEAGRLPVVGLQTGTSAVVNSISQKFNNGSEINRAGALSSNTQFSLFSSWTLFDGCKMYATGQRLKEQVVAADLVLTEEMLQTTINVATQYLNLIKQYQLLKNIDTLIAISNERLLLNKTRFESGLSAKMDYLQAQTDVNAQTAQKLVQLNSIEQTKENLNLLMGRNAGTPLEISERSFPENAWILPNELDLDKHPTIKQAKTQIGIAQLQKQEIEAAKYPTVDLEAAYNFSFNKSQAGFSLYNLSTWGSSGRKS
ncbi:MAG: TolC family protein [Sphingobacteriales bacterium]|nr:TolC family protein [Sphingobacteriales bacterium]